MAKIMLYGRNISKDTSRRSMQSTIDSAIPPGTFVDTSANTNFGNPPDIIEIVNNVAEFSHSRYSSVILANITGLGYEKCTVSGLSSGGWLIISSDGDVRSGNGSTIQLTDADSYICAMRGNNSSSGILKLTFS